MWGYGGALRQAFYGSGCLGTGYVDHTDLELRHPPVSACNMLLIIFRSDFTSLIKMNMF